MRRKHSTIISPTELLLGIAVVLALFFLASCSPRNANEAERTFSVRDINGDDSFVQEKNAIWPEASEGSCARLESLVAERSHRRSRFSFLAAPFSFELDANGRPRAIGSIDLSTSPLMQYVLTTPVLINRVREILTSTDDRFLEIVKERLNVDACENENPRSNRCTENLRLWSGAQAKAREGLIYQEKSIAVMRELRARFAGIFGDTDEMHPGKNASLFLALLERVGLFSANEPMIDPYDAEAILTTEVPLFPATRSWNDWLTDLTKALPATMQGLSSGSTKEERLCSLVLWQRVFAQLLMIKGYHGPRLNAEGRLPSMNPGATGIERVDVPGTYVDFAKREAVVLDPDYIPLYNPFLAEHPLLEGNHRTPLVRDREEPKAGTLADAVERMEAYSWVFAASSPAAYPANSTYFFGDLVETDTAIVPFQTHSLALGLLVMELRNLSFKYLAPVDTRTDSLLTDGSATGLVLLANGKDNIAAGEMRLYDLIRLTNAVVRTSDAFEKIYAFALEHKETLEARSLVYSLAKPEGAPFYDANKLQELQSLVAIFNRLKFPLAQRMIRMVESGDSCSAVETANYASNGIATRRVLSPCNEEILSAYRDSMRILAHQTGSRVFYRKSQ